MSAAILGLLSALPDLLKLIQEFATWINQVSGNDPQGFIKTLGSAMNQLNSAKTESDRQAAAKALADAIQGL